MEARSPYEWVREVPWQQQTLALWLARETGPGAAGILEEWLPRALERPCWPEWLFDAQYPRQILALWMCLAREARLSRRAPFRRAVSI